MTELIITTTPGTRLSWASPAEWIAQAEKLERRRISSKNYADRRAHLDALVDAGEMLTAAELPELVLLEGYLRSKRNRLAPARGRMAGSAWVKAIDLVNAAVAQRKAGR